MQLNSKNLLSGSQVFLQCCTAPASMLASFGGLIWSTKMVEAVQKKTHLCATHQPQVAPTLWHGRTGHTSAVNRIPANTIHLHDACTGRPAKVRGACCLFCLLFPAGMIDEQPALHGLSWGSGCVQG